jgi:predicted transcriptional regulator
MGYTHDVAKVLVSLPDDLLQRVDLEAHRRQTSRSELLRQAVSHELGWPDPDLMDAALARGRQALEAGPAFESTAVVREARDERDRRDRRRR